MVVCIKKMQINSTKVNHWIYILAIVIPLIAITLWVEKPTVEERLEAQQIKIDKVQQEINELAQEREVLRLEKIELMAENFNENYELKENYSDYDKETELEMYKRLESKIGIPYKLWGKGNWFLDCSWLFGTYAHYKLWSIDYNTLINHYSAENIRQRNNEKSFEDIGNGDFLYLMKWGKAVHIMYVNYVEDNIIHTIEANLDSWVNLYEYRFIQDTNGIFIEYKWSVYDFKITSNELLDGRKYLWEFLISSYIPNNWDKINCWGGSCAHTASGLPLNDSYAWKIVACPKQFSIGLNWEPKQKLYIEWHWIVECSDRGWLIVMKWETNSRGNVSSMNRLDLFWWMWTPKIKRNQTTRKVYLVE